MTITQDGSGELKTLVERFAAEEDSAARRSLLDQMMLKWAEKSDLYTSSYKDKPWLAFLDEFHGGLWIGIPKPEGWRVLESSYEAVSLFLYSNLLRQTHYADELEMLDYDMDESGNITLDIRYALEHIAKSYTGNPEQTKQSVAEFFLVLQGAGLSQYLTDETVSATEKMLATYGAELVDACRISWLAMKEAVGTYSIRGGYGADSENALRRRHESQISRWGRKGSERCFRTAILLRRH